MPPACAGTASGTSVRPRRSDRCATCLELRGSTDAELGRSVTPSPPPTEHWRRTLGSADKQGPLWGAAAQDWAEIAEPGQMPFYEAAFDAIGVGNGTNLLDVGSRAGRALQPAAKRGATASGIDAGKGFLAVVRERVPAADIQHADIEELPFADEAFDAVTAFNSVQYAADPPPALREIKRVAKPGAGVAVVTWGTAHQCEMRVLLGAIGALLPPPRRAPAGRSRSQHRARWKHSSKVPVSPPSAPSTCRRRTSTPTSTAPRRARWHRARPAWRSTRPVSTGRPPRRARRPRPAPQATA